MLFSVSCGVNSPSETTFELKPETPPKPKVDSPNSEISEDDRVWTDSLRKVTLFCESPRTSQSNWPVLFRGTAFSNSEAGFRSLRWKMKNSNVVVEDVKRVSVMAGDSLIAELKTLGSRGGQTQKIELSFLKDWKDTAALWEPWTEIPNRNMWSSAGRDIPARLKRLPWVRSSTSVSGTKLFVMPVKDRQYWGVYKSTNAGDAFEKDKLKLVYAFQNLALEKSHLVTIFDGQAYFNFKNPGNNRFQILKLDLNNGKLKEASNSRYSVLMLGMDAKGNKVIAIQERNDTWSVQLNSKEILPSQKYLENVVELSLDLESEIVAARMVGAELEFLDSKFNSFKRVSPPVELGLEPEFLDLGSIPFHPGKIYVEFRSPDSFFKSETYLYDFMSGTWRGPLGKRSCSHPLFF